MDCVKIGIGVSSIGRFLPFVGQAAGLFERHGISVEIVNQQDEEKVVEDIAAGRTPVGTPNAPSLVFSLLEGNDLVIVGGILNRPAFFLAAAPTVAGVEELRGRKVGINQPRRMAGMMMLALLRRWGLDAGKDLRLVDLGLNDRSLDALQGGEIDAALLPPEKAFAAEEEGFRVIADSLGLDCHWVPLATTRRFLAANQDLVRRVALVYAESVKLFRKEREAALGEIGRRLPPLAGRRAVLEKCCELFAERFEPDLAVSSGSIRSILQEVALQDTRAAGIAPETLVERVIER
ncbi:MAG TPA: ABC transporter substrate-binding protein [candidate division Zixibacteria bacterium]|nr:ABC transporter substrate-binding protein [candidate division Zixibacteria bacterium]